MEDIGLEDEIDENQEPSPIPMYRARDIPLGACEASADAFAFRRLLSPLLRRSLGLGREPTGPVAGRADCDREWRPPFDLQSLCGTLRSATLGARSVRGRDDSAASQPDDRDPAPIGPMRLSPEARSRRSVHSGAKGRCLPGRSLDGHGAWRQFRTGRAKAGAAEVRRSTGRIRRWRTPCLSLSSGGADQAATFT